MWISLIGFMGSGKSTVGRRTAERAFASCIDLDAVIAAEAGRSIAEIFARDGEAKFRALERRVLEAVDRDGDGVLSCGGGIVEAWSNRELLRSLGVVVWLDASWEILRARLERDGGGRPLIGDLGWDGLEELYLRRRPLYATTAHFRLRADFDDVEETARRVAACRSTARSRKEATP